MSHKKHGSLILFPTTQVVDDAIFNTMNHAKKARTLWARWFLKTTTHGQSTKHYQHVGVPITFTKQIDNIAGNHNLTKTY
jgi:hypothetical protein